MHFPLEHQSDKSYTAMTEKFIFLFFLCINYNHKIYIKMCTIIKSYKNIFIVLNQKWTQTLT